MATNANILINNILIQEVATIYYDAETYILEKMAKDSTRMLDDSWYSKKFKHLNKTNSEIAEYMEKTQKVSQTKLEESIITSYVNGGNAALVDFGLPKTILNNAQIPASVQRLVLEANGLIESNNLNVLRRVDDMYRKLQAEATVGMLTGIETRKEATQRLLNSFADKGITGFVDKAGRNWSLGSYSEMATRTVSQRAAIQGHIERQLEHGRDLVQISNHGSSCPLCAPYQGQVMSISGNHPYYPPLENAISNGLFHPNCKHSLSGFVEGMSRVRRSDADPKEYAYTQQQRANERMIRQWKKREAVALDEATKKKAHAKVMEWQSRQRSLLNNAERDGYYLRRKYEREAIKMANSGPKASGWILDIDKSSFTQQATIKRVPKAATTPKVAVESFEETTNKIYNALQYNHNNEYDIRIASRKTYEKWAANISNAERNALNEYTGDGYWGMNDILRNGVTYSNNHMEDKVKLAKKALDKANIEKDLYIRRGVSKDTLAGMFGERDKAKTIGGDTWIKELIDSGTAQGRVVEEKAFLSATPIPKGGFKKEVDIRILMPKGTKGVYIADISEFSSELETLVQAGTRFVVTDIMQSEGTKEASKIIYGQEEYIIYLKALIK